VSTATIENNPTASSECLYMSMELGEGVWKLGFARGFGEKLVKRRVASRDVEAILKAIASVKKSLGLAAEVEVRSGYEAGRDGFWLHRFLVNHGVRNLVMDSSSLEVNRRRRRVKTDDLDTAGLLDLLVRYWLGGSKKPFHVVRVPTVEEEDRRHLHRDLQCAKRERVRITNRMKGLLASHGVTMDLSRADAGERLSRIRQWDGNPVPPGLLARLRREWERVVSCTEMIRVLEAERREILRSRPDPVIEKVLQLNTLRGIGINSAWLYVMEFFGWREFRNAKEVGALAGLTPTPFQSGNQHREQGMSHAGNRHVRGMSVEIAWGWLRFQPQSHLSLWYERRFGHGSKRMRKIGIIALARKLLIELWRFLETGVLPEGAELKAHPAIR
jgi:transposase